MYLIDKRDGDDYVQTWTAKFDLKSNAGKAAANWATAAKDGVLTLNTGITFGGNAKKTFAYDVNTVFCGGGAEGQWRCGPAAHRRYL